MAIKKTKYQRKQSKLYNMKRTILIVVISGVLFASCGTAKKLESANAQIASMTTEVASLNTKTAELDKQVSQLKTENIQYGKEAEDCRKAKAAIAQKVDNLNKNLAERGTSMQKIREKVQTAIDKFEDAGATVTYKHGLVHINYTDDFFFKTGSSFIGVRGREALNTVAEVLRENPGVTAIIVGNTDTLSIQGKADNWSLSTERANAVVRILYHTYDINPARLTSAGRSKFNPVADNSTPEGREKNRRIEIILNPDLSRIWDLMED
jgi:chemotaxis protein MotB